MSARASFPQNPSSPLLFKVAAEKRGPDGCCISQLSFHVDLEMQRISHGLRLFEKWESLLQALFPLLAISCRPWVLAELCGGGSPGV